MTYSGGQRSARKASRPAFNIGDLLNQIGRSAQAVANPEAAYAEDWYRQGLTPAGDAKEPTIRSAMSSAWTLTTHPARSDCSINQKQTYISLNKRPPFTAVFFNL